METLFAHQPQVQNGDSDAVVPPSVAALAQHCLLEQVRSLQHMRVRPPSQPSLARPSNPAGLVALGPPAIHCGTRR